MANETFIPWCSQCVAQHGPADCPWKPAVSGVYEHNPSYVNPHHHTITNGGKKYSVSDPSVDMAMPQDTPVNPWDNQVGGQHYKKGVQPFEYAMANNLNSLEFSVVKYLRKKGDKAKRIEDLKKAKDCLEKLIWWEEHDGKI